MSYTPAQKAAYYKKKYQELAKGSTERQYYKRKYYKRSGQASNYKYNARYSKGSRFGGTTKAIVKRQNSPYAAGAEALGAAAGLTLGGPAGALIGGITGRGLHGMFQALTGFGDYKVSQNTLMKGGMSPPMVINSMGKGGYIIRHREYLGDVFSTEAFTIQSYPINPGVSTSFPWLSQIAQAFEEYRFRGIVYEFKSTSSDAVLSSASSSSLGTVVMATEYNVINPNFGSKIEMENYQFANSDKPSCAFYHPIECAIKQTPVSLLFCRTQPVPNGADPRLYDLGNFQIATVGMQNDGGVLGELWCTYEIEFYKPKYNSGFSIYTDHYNLKTVTNTAALGTQTGSFTQQLRDASSNPNWKNNGSISGDGSTYNFPVQIQSGKFLVVLNYLITNSSSGEMSVPQFDCTNCHLVTLWNADVSNESAGSNSLIPTEQLFQTQCGIIQVDAPQASFQVNGSLGTAAVNSGDFWVTQIDTAIAS